MRGLVIDVGGTHVKVLATGRNAHRQVESGPTMTAEQMVAAVKHLVPERCHAAPLAPAGESRPLQSGH